VQTGGVLDLATFALQLRGTFTLQASAEAKVSNYNPLPGNGTTPYNFASTSTFTFYGSVTGFSYRNPSVQTVTFGHVNWNSTGNATPAVNTIIAGNLIKRGSGELRCGTGSPPTGLSRTIVVNGNVNIKAGVLISNNATTPITGAMDIGGDLTIDSVGSVRGVNWTGDGTIRVGGNFVNSGSGQIVNIKPATPGATGNFTIYFKGTNTSTFTPGSNDSCRTFIVPIGKTVNVTTNGFDVQRSIEDSGALYLGTNVVKGVGNFILADGATLGIGSPDGITTSGATGNVQVTGTRTYSSLANYVYNGIVAQVTGNGFPADCNNLTINNPAGVTLSSNHAVNGVLTLTIGNVITGIDKLAISATGSISRTNGHIFGNLQMYIPTGTDVTRTFEIGDASNYTPIDLKFASVSVAGNLTGSTNVPDHPQIGTSSIDAAKSVNRYYSLISGGVTFTTYDAVFTFVTDDVDPGANTSNFIVKKYDDPNWHSVTTGNRTLTSTQALGVTSVCDFAIGETALYSITATAGPNGSIVPEGIVSVSVGEDQKFSFYPNWCYQVDSVFVDDVYVDSTTSFTFYNVTASHTIHVTFKRKQFTLTVNVEGSGTVEKTPDKLLYDCGETVTLEATPSNLSWKFKEWSGDTSGTVNPVIIPMEKNWNITATFERDSAYLVSYRSFLPESIALDKDNKGKINKYVLRKPDKIEFEFFVVVDSPNINDLHLEFSVAIDTSQFPFRTIPSALTMNNPDGHMKKWDLTFSPALDAGDTVWVNGYGNKKTLQKVSKYYWTRNTVLVGEKMKNPIFTVNLPRLPMPNRVNALYETMLNKAAAYGPNGFMIGKCPDCPHPDSGKYYGWLQTTKYGDLLKSLIVKRTGQMHEGTSRGFDHLTGKAADLTKKKTSLPPNKFDNHLLAQLIALKVNITASAMGITPPGFGELIYKMWDDFDGALVGKMIKEISEYGDQLMMGQYDATAGMKLYASPEKFAALDSIVRYINGAFEGAVDSSEFGAALHLTGTKQLKDIWWLRANPSVIPAVITPIASTEPEVPLAYSLYQNYPNPFNPTTTISFDLPEDAFVTLKIYNMLGQEVATLFDREELYNGTQEIEFSANGFASGVYFYRIVAEGLDEDGATTSTYQTVKKMMLLK
jgi:hypothetical protein